MSANIWRMALCALVCMFISGATAMAKERIKREIKGIAVFTIVVNMETGDWESFGEGHGAHYGKVVIRGSGKGDGTGPTSGVGTLTVANGDVIYWETYGGVDVVITGGTGRFEGATGEMADTPITKPVFGPGPTEGTFTVTYTSVSSGWITY